MALLRFIQILLSVTAITTLKCAAEEIEIPSPKPRAACVSDLKCLAYQSVGTCEVNGCGPKSLEFVASF